MEQVCLETLEKHGWNPTKKDKGKALPKRLAYHEAYRLFRCLEFQLNAIEDASQQSFLFLTREDIRDLGSGWYLIHNMEQLTSLQNDHITIVKPTEMVRGAPELAKELLRLPYEAHKSCLYYHLGKMFIELLGVGEDLELLYGSPLYFALQRALEPDPMKRHWLLV